MKNYASHRWTVTASFVRITFIYAHTNTNTSTNTVATARKNSIAEKYSKNNIAILADGIYHWRGCYKIWNDFFFES